MVLSTDIIMNVLDKREWDANLVQQVVPEFCYPKLCVGVCVGGAWVEVASTLKG